MKLTKIGGRARLLLRVGNVLRLNCWASMVSKIEPVAGDRLRLVAPALGFDHHRPTAESMVVFAFGFAKARLQLAPRQRLAWAAVCAEVDGRFPEDLAREIARLIPTAPRPGPHSRFSPIAAAAAQPARDRLVQLLLHEQALLVAGGDAGLVHSRSAAERAKASAANEVAAAAEAVAAQHEAELAAVASAVAELGAQETLQRVSSEVSAKLATQRDGGKITEMTSQLWKRLCLLGTAWNSYDHVHSCGWDFSSWMYSQLSKTIQLSEEVFLFASTEPQLVGSDRTVCEGELLSPSFTRSSCHCIVDSHSW